MSDKVVKLQKILYPQLYNSSFVVVHSDFNNELRELITKSGYEKDLTRQYFKNLKFLENLKKNCVNAFKLFEQLKNADGLYSMKLKGERNIRILFDFQIIENVEYAILYTCFEERTTKDYSQGIVVAKEKRKEIIDTLV